MRRRAAPSSCLAARARLGFAGSRDRTVPRNTLPSGWKVRELRTTPLTKEKKTAAILVIRAGRLCLGP